MASGVSDYFSFFLISLLILLLLTNIIISLAIVTGATDGIGKAMAFELARKGLNVLLISRTQSKLNDVKEEILKKYPKIEVRTLSIDYGNFDKTSQLTIAHEIKDLDVGVLINNVGMSYPFTKYFHELKDEEVDDLISLNIDSTTWMTRIVLPGMTERKRGAIVNIASAAGVTVSPLLAQYSAAKSYVNMFSRALNYELKNYNISVQCQVPLFVATKLAKIKKASITVASPAGYAKAAVACIGYEDLVSPFWSHAFQIWLLNALPESISSYITYKMHWDIRKRGIKKENEKDKRN